MNEEVQPSSRTVPPWLQFVAGVLAFVAATLVPFSPISLILLVVGWVLMLEGPHPKGIVWAAGFTIASVFLNFWVYAGVHG